ncbi:MAG TPA: YcxB family protein [Candidatus Acidoferrum sp.]|jgi:hypothetical protein
MDEPGAIQISFQLTQQEIYAANVSIALRRYRNLIRFLGAFAVIISVMLVGEISSGAPALDRFTPGVVFMSILAPLLFVATIFASAYAAAKALSDNPSLRGPTRWIFSARGISTWGPGGASELNWSTYFLVRETKTAFLLYPQRNFANVIPKRAFANEMEIARFRALLTGSGLKIQ